MNKNPMTDPNLAFDIFDRATGKHYRLYADGRSEGFGRNINIINRVPILIKQAVCAEVKRRNESKPPEEVA